MQDSETTRRLNALIALLSRNAPLPESYPAQEAENPVDRVKSASVGIPEPVSRSPERRWEKPVEEVGGVWHKAGYSRRQRQRDFADWDEPINGRDEV